MTDNIRMTPMVQIVTRDIERVFAFSEIALDEDDPATISDTEIKARVARLLEVEPETFGNLIVTRPATGNILIAPKPTYG